MGPMADAALFSEKALKNSSVSQINMLTPFAQPQQLAKLVA